MHKPSLHILALLLVAVLLAGSQCFALCLATNSHADHRSSCHHSGSPSSCHHPSSTLATAQTGSHGPELVLTPAPMGSAPSFASATLPVSVRTYTDTSGPPDTSGRSVLSQISSFRI